MAGTYANCPIVKRKDSREAIKENYAVEYVTDVKNMVIGSALAANNPMVSGINPKAKAQLVILKRRINKFSRTIDLSTEALTGNVAAAVEIGDGGVLDIGIFRNGENTYVFSTGTKASASGKAWAYVTPMYQGEAYTVEDEDGKVSTVTPEYGGELLFGQNTDIKAGDTVGSFTIVGTHDVFGYLTQKEA